MAGDWLKIEKDTPEKPEIMAIAARLDMDPEKVFAKCFKLWRWADSHTTNGNVLGVTLALLDAHISAPGFAQAMVEVGWLDVVDGAGSPTVEFPNFDRHMGKSGKRRALTNRRVAQHRVDVKRDGNAPTVTESVTREEKRREENKTPPTPPRGEEGGGGLKHRNTDSIPGNLYTDSFLELWREWKVYLAQKGQPLPQAAINRQLNLFADWGPERAVAAMDYTMSKNWVGIKEPPADWRSERPRPVTDAERAAKAQADREARRARLGQPPAPEGGNP